MCDYVSSVSPELTRCLSNAVTEFPTFVALLLMLFVIGIMVEGPL